MRTGLIPVVGIAGWSGSGKTTLIEKLIPLLKKKGYSAAVIKHDVHGISSDDRGKDSRRFLDAGAACCILCGKDDTLEDGLAAAGPCDIIIVEGFKGASIPKIGISRKACGKGFSAQSDCFDALVTDEFTSAPVPVFHPDDACGLADFIAEKYLK